ncbi:MAG: Rieske (2Fe-2S) protein [Oligoflexus sp.]
MSWIAVCQKEELQSQPWLTRQLQGLSLILFALEDDRPACFLDRCSHQDVRLSDFGKRSGDRLLCFAHGAVFDLHDGGVLRPPACEALSSFPCRYQGGQVEILLDQVEL